ncbi:unnamed protein product [Rhodiola kirilowii]
MVARTPPKRTKVAPLPLNPVLLRETVKKVDRCMARLQELQFVVAGGNKVVAGVSLSPRSTRTYLKTSLRCKHESFRNGNGGQTISPTGKFEGGWKRMSLPAMLVGETVGEIIKASQFAREIVQAVSDITRAGAEDPKTPVSTKQRKHNKPEGLEKNTQLKSRRIREKQNASRSFRSEPCSPKLQRARSRINFKVSPPKKKDTGIETEKEINSAHIAANRVSPRHKPWAKKTVLFPNPLFTSTSPNRQQSQRFYRTRSPIIARNNPQTPHKFLIKSPASTSSKFQVKVKKSPPKKATSPTRTVVVLSRKSPKRSRSPARLACCMKTVSPPRGCAVTISKKSPKMSTASKLHRSLSPARLATRLMSPLKSRKPVQMSSDGLMMPGSKQRPTMPMKFLIPRI